ncbi:coiled-coil domain-containing protein 18 isoform X2 [Amblyraja radiata]|uniref:coiled-coil domain-containing protein 18 isoform X2 n=1 Tax=Amblyraja radiata TaxID=386614 RepID=UPI0014036736|nr:coiled-coil domain-containing protein 18 isoform X2 [Amblyraja radiata]
MKTEVEAKDLQIVEYEQILKSKEHCILKQQQEVLGEGQQVRLAREQMQRCHLELRETQQRLMQVQREADRLALELDESIQLSHEKEACAAHIAEDLAAAQARESQLEIKTQAEIKKLKELVAHLKNAHEKEIIVLKESRPQLLASEENSTTHISYEQVLQLKQQLDKSQKTTQHLESELHTQREVISAAKEALIIKESEVARLQVKISGFERALGKQQLPSPMLQSQREPENRKDSTMQARSFYPLATNMNRLFSVGEINISVQDKRDASCPTQPEGAALFSSSPKAETEEDLEFGNLASNSDLESLSGMFNHLSAMERNNIAEDAPVDMSPRLSSEQIKSRVEECSAGRCRMPNEQE